jgi:hypothetical protein
MTIGTMIIALLIGTFASIIGGAIGGMLVGGKHIGNELAALLGGFYGPLAGVPGTIIALILLAIGGASLAMGV